VIDVNEIKEIIRKFEEREEVRGVIICDSTGLPIKSNLDTDKTEEVSAYITALIGKSRQVVSALDEGQLKFIRLETSKDTEIMVALEENLILIILK
jgi:predicted regulator of Ras-like GTPase activity (Roadblock/LC7/MglB family)